MSDPYAPLGFVWMRTCPHCQTRLEKNHIDLPWVCHWCGWRSDKEPS